MENEKTSQDVSKRAKDILDFSRKVDELADELLNLLKSTDTQALSGIKPYIDPRKNISKIIQFYDFFQMTTKKFNNTQMEFEKTQLISRSEKEAIAIEELEKHSVLVAMKSINNSINDLKEFENVKIVSKVLVEMHGLFQQIAEMIEDSILASLKRLPKVVDKLNVYTKFFLDNCENEKFMEKYTDMCLERLGFSGIENNFTAILQRTKNLTEHFNMVINFNIRILGKKRARATNDGLIKLMILELKQIILDALDKVRVEEEPEYIPFLIQLFSRLRHSDGDIVKEIEDLFVFKDDILILILNCYIKFYMEADLLTHPNEDLREERLVGLLIEILTLFDQHKDAKKAWVDRFGSSFGVHSLKELNTNFASKIFQNIRKLSESLEIEEKAIYLVNNIHGFKDLTTKVSGYEIKQIVYKNCETIVGIWKINISPLEGAALSNMLGDGLDNAKRYYLPEEERIYVTEKITDILQGLIAGNKFEGSAQAILDKIQIAYSGSTD